MRNRSRPAGPCMPNGMPRSGLRAPSSPDRSGEPHECCPMGGASRRERSCASGTWPDVWRPDTNRDAAGSSSREPCFCVRRHDLVRVRICADSVANSRIDRGAGLEGDGAPETRSLLLEISRAPSNGRSITARARACFRCAADVWGRDPNRQATGLLVARRSLQGMDRAPRAVRIYADSIAPTRTKRS